VLLSNTLHFTTTCSVLYNSYKYGTEGKALPMAVHGVSLTPWNLLFKKNRIEMPVYVIRRGAAGLVRLRQGVYFCST